MKAKLSQSQRKVSHGKYKTKYQRSSGNSKFGTNAADTISEEQTLALRKAELRQKKISEGEEFDKKNGFRRFSYVNGDRGVKRGWIFNMLATTVAMTNGSSDAYEFSSTSPERAAVDLYFLGIDGSSFKATVLYDPYFYVIPIASQSSATGIDSMDLDDSSIYYEALVSSLKRLYEPRGLKTINVVKKLDLESVNHLSVQGSKGRTMLKLVFHTVQQLTDVRGSIQSQIVKNQQREKNRDGSRHSNLSHRSSQSDSELDPIETLIDIREYDVPYIVRVCIDLNIRTGAWYTVTPHTNDIGVTLSEQDVEKKANPTFLAFDIECTKAPLKFPDANLDSIFMISYMVNGQGYLILSRHAVGADVGDFEYTPKPSCPGPFKVFNELTEEGLIRKFLFEFERHHPQIVVTYNGDFFDWPFLERRAAIYGLNLRNIIGIERFGGDDGTEGEYRGRCCVHMDAFSWVQRDSYLPQGSQGLKAVTKYKMGYDPVEVEPEDMVRLARERPVHMATYSVSDAVATYYLYEKYVHMFIFSLCTIIPMIPEDVLRKGSGTLCEALLMVQACTKNIICPNKQTEPLAKFYEGHLLESETYIGGKVECLETGVYRSDLEYSFELKPVGFQGLIDNIDRDLTFAIEVEGGIDRSSVTNYDDVRRVIVEKLERLRDNPMRSEKPNIFHLDVGAMYPNIILTNRLQPYAIVTDFTCAACDFNQSKNNCKRKMEWVWRGDYNPATRSKYDQVKEQLSREKLSDGRSFCDASEKEQATLISTRLKQYARNAYKKTKVTEEVTRMDTVCMRENDFYVNTVREFRDRRYEYKKLTKIWGQMIGTATDAISKKEAEDKAIVYDSLQVAHKCILNSFYGYVMRKGARWRSMEMAGIVTKTGADLITQARKLVEQIGRPLELDTDGIWCIIPQSFPDHFFFKLDNGSKLKLEYPCTILNAEVHQNFTNHQYQSLSDPSQRTYETRSECSIFFELDGPHRCMVLPASTDEGRLLKKRYAVFNNDGSLSELKGFELKRRGELELIKNFQSQVFERFLNGQTLMECYESVAEVANNWLDMLDTQGQFLDTDELMDLISENRNMSKHLDDYGDQKGTSQTTARRLGEFLGADFIKDKGLNCRFVIAEHPSGAAVTERAIPTAIWKAEPAVKRHYLRKWLNMPGLQEDELDIRKVLDWGYYRERLGKTIQRIITIPAALQNIPNPVPRIAHPSWLQNKVRRKNDRLQQQSIRNALGWSASVLSSHKEINPTGVNNECDIEDITLQQSRLGGIHGIPIVHSHKGNLNRKRINECDNFTAKITESVDKISSRVSLCTETFQHWLKQKKKLWKLKGSNKLSVWNAPIESSFTIADSSTRQPKKSRAVGNMESYIRDAALALTQHDWHIIEIREMTVSEMGSSVGASSGQYMLWVMIGNGNLQKIQVNVPRVLYLNSFKELPEIVTKSSSVKRVDRQLPHNKTSLHLYEVRLPENQFRSTRWLEDLFPADNLSSIESFYELDTPVVFRSILDLGCTARLNSQAEIKTSKFDLADIKRVDRPSEGPYLNPHLKYKRIFVYESLHARTKMGIAAVFFLDDFPVASNRAKVDVTNPQSSDVGEVQLVASCDFWVVKPGVEKGQRNLSKKRCEDIFIELLNQILTAASDEGITEYSCLSNESQCTLKSLRFVESDKDAYAGVQDLFNGYLQANNGPTLLLFNSLKSPPQIRKTIPAFSSFPLIQLSFPPGLDHNPATSSLPALNWEPRATQLCFEAFFYMALVAFPEKVSYARFGKIPVGNLGFDAAVSTFDVAYSRLLQKSRSLLWASEVPGAPDIGRRSSHLSSTNQSGRMVSLLSSERAFDVNYIWDDDSDNSSEIIRYPGAYRSICVEINIYNLAVAALSDGDSLITGSSKYPSDGVEKNGENLSASFLMGLNPLGDEMSTMLSLQTLRTLVQTWLREAAEKNNISADKLLGNLYRFISSRESILSDPALHRVLVSLMKATFNRLLNDFERLGSKIIFADFSRIIIATQKTSFVDAKEYIEFVLSTIKKAHRLGEMSTDDTRLSLQPNHFFSHYFFLDENNFCGIRYELREPEVEEESEWAFSIPVDSEVEKSEIPIVPTYVSGWNMSHYLPDGIIRKYFLGAVSRLVSDVYQKQVQLVKENNENYLEELLKFKNELVSGPISEYLTKAVAEIINDEIGPDEFPQLPGSHLVLVSPALEFVKNVLVVLDLDLDVERAVHLLKKSLLAQIGIEEYSRLADWINPCASFVLKDVFCQKCYSCHDVNLCVFSHLEDGEELRWVCGECHEPYDPEYIEYRLMSIIERKCLRYQLQDLRCTKTDKLSTRLLSRLSDHSERLKTDISRHEISSELHILRNLARYYRLEWLLETTELLLGMYTY